MTIRKSITCSETGNIMMKTTANIIKATDISDAFKSLFFLSAYTQTLGYRQLLGIDRRVSPHTTVLIENIRLNPLIGLMRSSLKPSDWVVNKKPT